MQAARDAMHSELATAQAKVQRLQVGCSWHSSRHLRPSA